MEEFMVKRFAAAFIAICTILAVSSFAFQDWKTISVTGYGIFGSSTNFFIQTSTDIGSNCKTMTGVWTIYFPINADAGKSTMTTFLYLMNSGNSVLIYYDNSSQAQPWIHLASPSTTFPESIGK